MVVNDKKICLYCMGAFGIRTFFLLADRGISVSCFGDNQKEKIGKSFHKVKCLSYDECLHLSITKYKIIICNKEPSKLLINFQNAGFEVYDCKHVWEFLEKIPIVASLTETWSSPEKLSSLHSVIMNVYTGKNKICMNSSYCTTLLQDIASIMGK